ncbi:hypothetical protein AAMO2058_001036100 [Amorphochlora amoebiformis]
MAADADSVTLVGIERLQRIVLADLQGARAKLEEFNSYSQRRMSDVKPTVAYCRRIKKLREILYKTFERIRNLKQKIATLEALKNTLNAQEKLEEIAAQGEGDPAASEFDL